MRWVWHLGGLSASQLAKNVWAEIDKDDVLGRAAQLSFYFLLALFPLLIFVSAVLALIAHDEKKPAIVDFVRRYRPLFASHPLIATGSSSATA